MLKIGEWAYTQNVLRPAMSIQANMTCSLGVQNEHRPTGLCPEAVLYQILRRSMGATYEESDRNLMAAAYVGNSDN